MNRELMQRIDLELDKIRTALRFPTTSDAPLLIASDLALFWLGRGHVEEMRGVLAQLLESHPNAAPFARACLDVLAGHFARMAGDSSAARSAFERALVYFSEIDDQKNIAAMLGNLGGVHNRLGDLGRAREMMERAVQISREINRPQVLAPALDSIGSILFSLGKHDEAQASLEESIAIQRTLGDARALASKLHNLAELHLELGNVAEARPLVEEGSLLWRSVRDRSTMASVFSMEGRLLQAEEQHFAAACSVAAARMALRDFGAGLSTGVEEALEKIEAAFSPHLTAEQLEAAERQGRVHLRAWLRDGD